MDAIGTGGLARERQAAGHVPVLHLHGHPLEGNMARAATAEAVGTFVLVLAIISATVAATLARPVAGPPYGSLAVPAAGGLGCAGPAGAP